MIDHDEEPVAWFAINGCHQKRPQRQSILGTGLMFCSGFRSWVLDNLAHQAQPILSGKLMWPTSNICKYGYINVQMDDKCKILKKKFKEHI